MHPLAEVRFDKNTKQEYLEATMVSRLSTYAYYFYFGFYFATELTRGRIVTP